VHIYHNVTIGNRVIIHSGAVIGADGFGYVRQVEDRRPGEVHRKIPQVGRVVIEDDVEIGANSTIDRATLASTRIGRGTKIDNLVTVGHNSVVGQDCIIIGQAGLSGSTVLCDGVTIAGQAGLAGHLRVGAGAIVGAQAGVTKDVPPGATVLGSPAEDVRQARRALPLIVRLPEMRKTLLAHDRRLAKLEGSSSDCYAEEPSGPREEPNPE
jgi:UDP-3-O-[3-hydroxymyristoyl] glucosamine N-acyltransferase